MLQCRKIKRSKSTIKSSSELQLRPHLFIERLHPLFVEYKYIHFSFMALCAFKIKDIIHSDVIFDYLRVIGLMTESCLPQSGVSLNARRELALCPIASCQCAE